MDIGRVTFIFAHIFILNPAAVASCTICLHVRALFEKMPADESPLDRIRTADVALPATRMATRTVVIECFVYLVQGRLASGAHSGVQDVPVRRQRNMKAFGRCRCDLLVALPAGKIGFCKGRIFYNSFMCCLPIGVGGIASMA